MSKLQRALTKRIAKAIIKNKRKYFIDFQVIHPLLYISCPTLERPAVTVFEISSFLCQNLQRAITLKHLMMFFLNFHQIVCLLSFIS